MQKFASVSYSTGDQHKEATQARIERDLKDTKLLYSFLTERNPFNDDPALRNIVTGVTAADTVNAENAKAVGTAIVNKIVGKNVVEHSFRKNDQIVNMASNNAVKVSHEQVNIDPQVLFQRLVTAGISNDQLPGIFQYELSNFPPALFEAKNVMKAANKPALADAMWALMPQDVQGPSENDKYVVDGGSLLHRIPWQKGSTYNM